MKLIENVLLWLVVISAVLSSVQYFMKFWSQVDGSIKQRRKFASAGTNGTRKENAGCPHSLIPARLNFPHHIPMT